MSTEPPKIIQKGNKRGGWFQYYGELIYQDFLPKLHFRINLFGTRHKIQMCDQPVFRTVFCACITVKTKIYLYLGADIFFRK